MKKFICYIIRLSAGPFLHQLPGSLWMRRPITSPPILRVRVPDLEIEMIRGEGHNHPLMAIWVEDEKGNLYKPYMWPNPSAKEYSSMEMPPADSGCPERFSVPQPFPTGHIKRGIKNETGPLPSHPRQSGTGCLYRTHTRTRALSCIPNWMNRDLQEVQSAF